MIGAPKDNQNSKKRSASFKLAQEVPPLPLKEKSPNKPNRGESSPGAHAFSIERESTFSIDENTPTTSMKVINHVDDVSGLASIHQMTIDGNHKIISSIITDLKGDINLLDKEGRTALHHAFLLGKEKTCELLISLGASPYITMRNGKNIAHIAASQNNHDLILLIFTQFGKNLFFVPDNDGYMPIHYLHDDLPHYHTLKNLLVSFTDLRFLEDESITIPTDSNRSRGIQGIQRSSSSRESAHSPSSSTTVKRPHPFNPLFYLQEASSSIFMSPRRRMALNRSRAASTLSPIEEIHFKTQIIYTHFAHIHKNYRLLDQALVNAGMRAFKSMPSNATRQEKYKRFIQKYIFGKHDKEDSQKQIVPADVAHIAWGLLKNQQSHTLLNYINNHFKRLDSVNRLFAIFFVKELIMSLQVHSPQLDEFKAEFERFNQKLSAHPESKNKAFARTIGLLTDLYNQKMSLIRCVQNKDTYKRKSLQLMLPESIEDILDKIAANKLPSDEYYLFIANLSEDLIYLIANSLMQVTPNDLEKQSKPNAIENTTRYLNLISTMVSKDILSYDLAGRVNIIKCYVDLTNYILKSNELVGAEYNLFISLAGAILSHPISRLKQTHAALPEEVKVALAEFEELISPASNFKNIRQKLTHSTLPLLLHLRKDMVAAGENADVDDKLLMEGQLLRQFQYRLHHALSLDYSRTACTDLTNRLEVLGELNITSQRLYALSYQCEAGRIHLSDDMPPESLIDVLDTKQPELLNELPSIMEWKQQRHEEAVDEILELRQRIKALKDKKKLLRKVEKLVDELKGLNVTVVDAPNNPNTLHMTGTVRSTSASSSSTEATRSTSGLFLNLPLSTPVQSKQHDMGARVSSRTPRFLPLSQKSDSNLAEPNLNRTKEKGRKP